MVLLALLSSPGELFAGTRSELSALLSALCLRETSLVSGLFRANRLNIRNMREKYAHSVIQGRLLYSMLV